MPEEEPYYISKKKRATTPISTVVSETVTTESAKPTEPSTLDKLCSAIDGAPDMTLVMKDPWLYASWIQQLKNIRKEVT